VSALWYAKKNSKEKKEPYNRRKRAHLSDTRNKEMQKQKSKKKKRALLLDAIEPYY
jgi:hypothetical protein